MKVSSLTYEKSASTCEKLSKAYQSQPQFKVTRIYVMSALTQ